MMNNKVTKVELKKVFKRSFMYGSSWNYERMQNLGFLYTILPVLKKTIPRQRFSFSCNETSP